MTETGRKRRFAANMLVVAGLILLIEPIAPQWIAQGNLSYRIALWGAPGLALWSLICLLFPKLMIDPDRDLSDPDLDLQRAFGPLPIFLPVICFGVGALLRWVLM